MVQKILVTGTAGFIGFHLVEALLVKGHQIVGIDNINDYYDRSLKFARLEVSGIKESNIEWHKEVQSEKHKGYRFVRMALEDKDELMALCAKESFDVIINLAAQAGVRYSIQNPDAYIEANVVGFLNILEAARHFHIKHLIYASSSSVYGMNSKIPFSINDKVETPVSLYAATKKANELMAYTYSHLYGFKTTGLRFFTVYGPWGRPDMAMFLFTDAILNGKPLHVFNNGDLSRDFTYIDDIISGILPITEDTDYEDKYQLFNIGNSKPVQLLEFIKEIESTIGKQAEKVMMPMQPGDVIQTWADVHDLKIRYGYNPNYSVQQGIKNFVNWYREYYKC